MKKNILSLLILISGILISSGIIGLAHAQTTTSIDQTEPPQQTQQQKNLSNIQYPIAELGNCVDQASCKTYCDSPDNTSACVNFAEQKNLFTKNEVATAKKFIDTGSKGPGSCSGQAACEQYCGDPTHIEECTAFAEKNGMMSDQQLQDSKKVVAAIKSGLKPPACAGPEKCSAYCSSSLHMQECMAFSLAAGIVPDNQKEQMQKTLDAFKQGIKPPACQPNPPGQSGQSGQSGGSNEGQGFNPGSGVNGNGPGLKNNSSQPNQPEQSGQGLQACDQYCADPSHVEECVKFSVAIGNMTEEQGQNSIKNGNKGPGGCIGKDACDTFCNNPDNQETCFNFAKDNGMISENQSQQSPAEQQRIRDYFSTISPEVLDCLNSSVGADVVEKMKTGSVSGRKPGDAINQCFTKFGMEEVTPDKALNIQGQQNQQGQNQQGQQGNKFQPGSGAVNSGGQQMPQQAGPGGCKGPEECQKYCASNPEVCKNFQPPQNGQGQPNQPSQRLPQQQPGQPNQGVTNVGPCGTGPGTCSGIGPDDINPNNGGNGPGGPNQPGQMQPQQPQQPQQQQNPPPPAPTSFLQGVQNLIANVLNAFR